MHDYFDILGVPASARAVEVRRRCAGHVRRRHPDFRQPPSVEATPPAVRRDAAVEFVTMAAFADRVRRHFFGSFSSSLI